jgi:putative inorganic carbon (HCO3(-)) transporter
LLTAFVGVWAAYDRAAAWQRFALIALGMAAALAIAWLGQLGGERSLALIGLGCAFVAVAVTGYLVLTYDWQAMQAGKPGFALLYQIGLWIQAHRPNVPIPEDLQLNVAGSALALLTPLGAGAVAWCWQQRRYRPLAVLGLLAVLLSLGGLLLTMSRGALLGIAVGLMVSSYLAWRRESSLAQRWGRTADILFLVLCLALALGLAILLSRPTPVDGSATSRPQLWSWAADLIADYPFTGSGLGSTMMVHTTYLLIIHVGYITHMHNVFLQIGVEQGVPGMVAFLALLLLAIANLATAYRRRGNLWLVAGAAVGLSALVVHGMFDAVPYYSRLAPVTFIPLGFALGLTAPPRPEDAPRAVSSRLSPATLVALVAFLMAAWVVVVLFSRPGQAALQTNLGAVAQTRAELSRYTGQEWPIQDALRRSPEIDLGPAIARYQAALASDPRQASANRRLGQIEMSQGKYGAARQHLETAYQEAPQRHAHRYLLGESYAIAGQAAEALELWRAANAEFSQEGDWLRRVVLPGREYWYDSIGEPQRADAIRSVRSQLESKDVP